MSKFFVGDIVLQTSCKAWSHSRYEITAVDGNRVRLKVVGSGVDQGFYSEGMFELVSRPEPHVYSVRQVAVAIAEITGNKTSALVDSQIVLVNNHLRKTTNPKYKEAQENLAKAEADVQQAQQALDIAKAVVQSFN